MGNLNDVKKVIERTGLTKCEDTNCEGCEFDQKSPEASEFGNYNICMLLNEVFKTGGN
jgi:hypothetical protein